MQSQNKLFEDFSKVATSALGTLAGMTREVEEQARRKAREFVAGDEGISRDEFEAVKANAAAAREMVETLKAEVAALRAELSASKGARPASGKAKPEA
ncbi:accessory factor UbiK family protein [Polymorphobacter sp.]|uniref:accessory factor UbiK family protein n=1 Tax=Polymorphobacter sp. TaxID=1909290 RepID=UPI003F6F4FBD